MLSLLLLIYFSKPKEAFFNRLGYTDFISLIASLILLFLKSLETFSAHGLYFFSSRENISLAKVEIFSHK
jgi:hypothetical protein